MKDRIFSTGTLPAAIGLARAHARLLKLALSFPAHNYQRNCNYLPRDAVIPV